MRNPERRSRGERLIQTVVSKSLGTWVEARAVAEGNSVSGYVRRLLLREQAYAQASGDEGPPASSSDELAQQITDCIDLLVREHTESRDALGRAVRLIEARQGLSNALRKAIR